MPVFSWPLLLSLSLACIAAGLIIYFRRILDYFLCFLRMQLALRWFLHKRRTVADLWEARVKASPERTALVFEGKEHSYAELDSAASRVGLWAMQHGLAPRDRVALLMENRPAFLWLWIGLAKAGVTTALLNTNLKRGSLLHCIQLCEARCIIVGEECLPALREIRSQLPQNTQIWVHREQPPPLQTSRSLSSSSSFELSDVTDPLFELNSALDSIGAAESLSRDFASTRRAAQLGPSDLLFLIFTSGTTGMPKAAKIKHMRWSLTSASFVSFFGLRSSDRIYCCLPLYHSSGGMIGFACAWDTGAAVILSRKFSARGFFTEASRANATVVQYIGQIARYLIAAPTSPADRAHAVRMALGNGMPEEVWRSFQSRFGVAQIAEFYASTEGNANLVNRWDKPGVIGWIPRIARVIYPLRIVRFDPETEQPLRLPATDGSGASWCVQCSPGETGELLARIDSLDPARSFDGYTSASATASKILRDVFAPGDAYFRSGDLVSPDGEGFIRFRDRIGDTFRWKGENVSTMEVAAVIGAFESPAAKRAKAAAAAAEAEAAAAVSGPSSNHRDEDIDLEERAGLLPSASSSLSSSAAAASARSLVLVHEVTVYGVAVTGNDGRAGMASLVLARSGSGSGGGEGGNEEEASISGSAAQAEDPATLAAEFDFAAFYSYLHSHLPPYQIPFFLRLQKQLECTSTFKPKKVRQDPEGTGQAEALCDTELVAEGFDPRVVRSDPLLFRDETKRAFVPLDAALYQRIQSGLVRL